MAHNLSDIRRQVEARVAQEEAEHGTGPEQEAHDREGARGLRLIPMDELLAEPRVTDWLIRDYFERATLACLFGLSGTMKSFVALDVGLSIAAGLPWQGCRVKQGPVIYVAGEGFGGLSKRIKVWTRQHDVSGSIPFYVSDRAVAVLDPDSMADAQAAIDALAGQVGNPALVIVDTVARNFGPGNENATPDMSAFVAGLDALKSRYGCAVLAVHHTGLTAQERGRGSYALHAGLDYEFRLEVQGDIRVLSATKAKDSEPPMDVAFLPEIVATGWTDPETGADITSVVLNRTELPGKKERALSGAKRIALDALRACCEENGQAHIREWRAEAYGRCVSASEDIQSQGKAFRRAVRELLDMGLIETKNDLFWESGQADIKRTCPDLSVGQKADGHGHIPIGMSVCPPSGPLSFAGENQEGGAV